MKNLEVDRFFERCTSWCDEFSVLREIALQFDVEETLKWGQPCYTYKGSNVFLIHGFKEYCAILFMKGAVLENEHPLLIQQTESVQAARQMRFTSVDAILQNEAAIRACMAAALNAEDLGLKVNLKRLEDFAVPEVFQKILESDTALKSAFQKLSPGRQKAYLLHFNSAKQEKTQWARIKKWEPHILAGKGMND